jgi:hypothetical protein
MQSDTPLRKNGEIKDPDFYSPTLRSYHKLLWSKPLPNGALFTLQDSQPKTRSYLYHQSDIGEFHLASDSVIPTFQRRTHPPAYLVDMKQEELKHFYDYAYTIGGMMIWPGKKKDGMTINQARGVNRKIGDRFDLTIECVKRYYDNEWSPLSACFTRYSDFFALFGDFKGFIDFFLLNDLVTEDPLAVQMFTDFNPDFSLPTIPLTQEAYTSYMHHAMRFLEKRNSRIDQWAKTTFSV